MVFWQPNRAPEPGDSIRAQTLEPGDTIRIGLSRFFTDPDRDPLRYAARSSEPAIAAVSLSRNTLIVAGRAPGSTTIEVIAHDVTTRAPGSLSVTQHFEVTVRLRPRPDLVVDLPQDSLEIGPEQSFFLNAVVRNSGTLDVASGTTVRFHLSADTIIDTDDTVIASDTVGPLPVSTTKTATVQVTSPSTVGTYYYGACVDAVAEESATDNNCSSVLIVVVDELRPPNRAPTDAQAFPRT